MDFQVEKFVSNFVQNQFPLFYQEEGPNFILFTKAYYEWMEESGNPIREARTLFDYRDIDNTIEDFLLYFQKKYLYGIPFNVISNKRFLLKHILDVYRSKGTIQCYRLLFKLLYNEDIEIYLPGRDILKASDGTWVIPKYIEVSRTDNLSNFVGKIIIGVSSGTTAVVESYTTESYNRDIINILFITNILPTGGNFTIGEKLVLIEDAGNGDAISAGPNVIGSLSSLTILNGGQNFNVGDIIKVVRRSLTNNDIISYGTEGLLKVTALNRGAGSLNFNIINGGFGFMANASTFVYRNDLTGNGASFDVGSIADTKIIEYNTDIICDYMGLQIGATSYNFPKSPSANATSNIGTALSFTNNLFGSLSSLYNIVTGNGYTNTANVFVRSTMYSNVLTGNVSYSTSSNTVTGTSTIFDQIYTNNDVIFLQADGANNSTGELQVIREVTNSTQIILYGPPEFNSTSTAQYRAAPVILPSNFALYETTMYRTDNTINGLNDNVLASPVVGNNIIASAVSVNSGKGYLADEVVYAYLYSCVSNNIQISVSGSNYTNGDILQFSGGSPSTPASGFVTTNNSGSIVSTTLDYRGSGYIDPPSIFVKSRTGSGAVLYAELSEFNTLSQVIGKVNKSGIGKGRGYWSTTRGFLNSDKYIQDSYYYQDYSYEIRVAQTLDKYKSVLYDTFHSSGSELFGRYLSISVEDKTMVVLDESISANTTMAYYLLADGIEISADSSVTVDTITI